MATLAAIRLVDRGQARWPNANAPRIGACSRPMARTSYDAGTGASESALTPLGPGGRPFARWRPLVTLLALAALAAVAVVLLSERAPGVIGDVSDRVATGLDRRAPDARRVARRAVVRTGVEERDTVAHVFLWAGATLLAGLATWSWRSLTAVVVLVLVASFGLELVQEQLAPSRVSEWRDAASNVVGVGIGLTGVLCLASVSGLPARIRRGRAPRQDPPHSRPPPL